ncbi:MAG: hypothetical protein FWC71_11150 [Defluviitaleaceae bacterium]|nr:hypothetical protein [Defluviitaleaceae bacterium]
MKKVAALFIFFICFMMITGCNNETRNEGRYEVMIDRDRAMFAIETFMFDLRIVVDGEVMESSCEHRRPSTYAFNMLWPGSPTRSSFYTELVFVRNREEAQDFPDNIIVAWPVDRNATKTALNTMNRFISRTVDQLGGTFREPINLEDFGLTYPIDMTDLVENAEQVLAVFKALSRSERQSVRVG